MPSAKTILKAAQDYERAGRRMEASMAYRQVLQKQPSNADALLGSARILIEEGAPERALPLLQRAARARPRDPYILFQLGVAHHSLHQVDEALDAYARASRARPGLVDPYIARARLLNQARRYDESRQTVETALGVAPGNGFLVALMAWHERRDGNLDEARQRLERALDADLTMHQRIPCLFEYGHVLDELDEPARSFDAFERAQSLCLRTPAARAVRADEPWNLIRRSRDLFTPDRFEQWEAETFDDDLRPPVFLVGFPRSGTTLVEQMLDAHPDVCSLDERPTIGRTISALTAIVGPAPGYPDNVPALTHDQARRARRAYAEALADFADPKAGVIVDKMPLDFLNIGLIARVFPDARILFALRDPRAVCLSCHMQQWSMNPFMANLFTIERIGAFYEAAMGFWLDVRDHLRLPIHHFRYEDVVADPETQARAITDFLSLQWSPELLRSHERSGKRFVSTPSAEAVARPISTAAAARWKRYRNELRPVEDRLGRFIEAFVGVDNPL